MVEITDISILQKEAASSKPPFRHHAPRTVYRKHGSLLHHLSGADSGDTWQSLKDIHDSKEGRRKIMLPPLLLMTAA